MATVPKRREPREIHYPTGDGKPLAETPIHRDNLLGLIEVLRLHFRGDPNVYISGNMFLYYVEGDKRRHVSPDVFVVRGIDGANNRDAYFTWVEHKGPDVVFEFTSPSTKREDLVTKFNLYRDVLRVPEYFLFDPKSEYLQPSMRGYRLNDENEYVPIEPVFGRLPSEVLGLHLERNGTDLRLFDSVRNRWAPSPEEFQRELRDKAESELRLVEADRDRLRAELDALRNQISKVSKNGK